MDLSLLVRQFFLWGRKRVSDLKVFIYVRYQTDVWTSVTFCPIKNASIKLSTEPAGVDITVIGTYGCTVRITMTRQYVCGNTIVKR